VSNALHGREREEYVLDTQRTREGRPGGSFRGKEEEEQETRRTENLCRKLSCG
jgi:hypothetical protein